MIKPTKCLCTQQRLRSAWASSQSGSESSLCAQWVAKNPTFLHADSEDSHGQADLSLHWAHMPLCWFCHEAAHFYPITGVVWYTEYGELYRLTEENPSEKDSQRLIICQRTC